MNLVSVRPLMKPQRPKIKPQQWRPIPVSEWTRENREERCDPRLRPIITRLRLTYRAYKTYEKMRIRLTNSCYAICRAVLDQTQQRSRPANVRGTYTDKDLERLRKEAKEFYEYCLGFDARIQTEELNEADLDEMTRWALIHIRPFHHPLEPIRATEELREAELEAWASQLPAAAFVQQVPGFGLKSFAKIVGCVGDLSRFDNPANLWRAMGVGLLEVNGEFVIQRKSADPKLAIRMAYSPQRHSVMHVIGESLMKRPDGKYRGEYERYKASQQGKLPPYENGKENKMGPHMRALRYIEKMLLRDLWSYWVEHPLA